MVTSPSIINQLIIVSNMCREEHQIDAWMAMAKSISDGVIIVFNDPKDPTIQMAKDRGAIAILDDIIVREGYGPARNHLREMAREYFPFAEWALLLDADERILPEDYHRLRVLKDYLNPDFNAVAFPRIDWKDTVMTEMAKDWHVHPDYQCRMTRLYSKIWYVRKLHEQIAGARVYADLQNPKIHHFHRSAPEWKRTQVGKVCAKLHAEDAEYGHSYPKHHKEDHYYNLYEKEGL